MNIGWSKLQLSLAVGDVDNGAGQSAARKQQEMIDAVTCMVGWGWLRCC